MIFFIHIYKLFQIGSPSYSSQSTDTPLRTPLVNTILTLRTCPIHDILLLILKQTVIRKLTVNLHVQRYSRSDACIGRIMKCRLCRYILGINEMQACMQVGDRD